MYLYTESQIQNDRLSNPSNAATPFGFAFDRKGRPLDMIFSRNGRFLSSLNMRNGTITTFELLDGGGLKPVATLGSLPATATGLAVR